MSFFSMIFIFVFNKSYLLGILKIHVYSMVGTISCVCVSEVLTQSDLEVFLFMFVVIKIPKT